MNREERYVRSLERTIERQEKQIAELVDRLMLVTGTTPPSLDLPLTTENEDDEEGWVSDPGTLIEA